VVFPVSSSVEEPSVAREEDRVDRAEEEDVERIRAERDALERRVETLEARPERRRRVAKVTSTICVVLSILLFAVAVPATWARRTLLDTDRYVATVAPLAGEPAIQEYVARVVTAQVFEALDVQERLSGRLEERAPRVAFLAAPITNSVETFMQKRVQTILGSQAFATVWTATNRYVHEQLLAALEGGGGEGDAVQVQDGQVRLNLLPLVNGALGAVGGLVSNLVGHPVTLPEVTAEQVPSEVVTKLESTLGIDLPDGFGTIVVYDSTELEAVQQAVDRASRAIVVVVVLLVILTTAAIWISPRRRRTILQLASASAVVLVVERRFAIAESNSIVDMVKPENQPAARALVDQVLGGLLRYTGWFLLIALLVLVIGLLTGPYPWARTIRRRVAELGRAVGDPSGVRGTTGAPAWVARHRDALMLAGAGVAVFVMFVVDLPVGGFVALLLLLAAYELAVYRIGTAPIEVPDASVEGA
jgi:hypothetical protein